MSFLSILETLFIGPLKLIFEIIFEFANRLVGHPGLAIIFLSLVMNILVLPLYRRADAMQEASRDIEAKLQKGVSHIRKTFNGDERMMVLQTYYRQNNYKPTSALNGSVSLLLEIPFFMAAYQFLSHLDILNGVSFGPIKDLGAPDGLIVIAGFSINVLPVIMTLVNVISSAIYLKGFPLKTKIQLYAMALFFLVFLYTSPSCLVFYWTLNNVFSLVKTIFYKIKNPQKVLRILMTVVGIALIVFGSFFYKNTLSYKLFVVAVGVLLQLPMITNFIKTKFPKTSKEKVYEPNKKAFVLGGLFLTVLVGLLIPSTFIAASPQEYVDVTYFHNPLWYVVSALCLSAGTFLVWLGVFYWLASPKGKVMFTRLVWILCGVMLVNYMFFGTKLGVISSILQYENGMVFQAVETVLNIVAVAAVSALMLLIIVKWKKIVIPVLLTATIALGGMSIVNVVTIKNSVEQISTEQKQEMPNVTLSKNGKNVIVLMLDRALGSYVPYMFKEDPSLAEKFAGFTYYSNTVSFGGFTNFGTPPLFGGYEYTPVEMNKRNSEALVTKHNEALRVMPVLFSKNGYKVTVCDPVYANYQWYPDLSIYDEYPEIKAYNTQGLFTEDAPKIKTIENNKRNFFCFSMMKSMPLLVQPLMYDNGTYNQVESNQKEFTYTAQVTKGKSEATGLNGLFMRSYSALSSYKSITNVSDSSENTFTMMVNDLTHEPMLLQEPEYEPKYDVDNREYDKENKDRFNVNGVKLHTKTESQMAHYQTNMATFKKLGMWFDYLREIGVYDNTKIILVADHGRDLFQIDQLVMGKKNDSYKNVEYYYPLLMVKDFGSKTFTTSTEFMTNADVPTIATNGLIDNPINPFTGKAINNSEKNAHEQFVILSEEFETSINNGNTFKAAKWASVKNNMWDKNNWTFYDKTIVLSEHAAP